MAFCDPNPLASIAYASCIPPGIGPTFDSEALTSRAAYERLNRAAAHAETLVLYRLDQLAGCRDSLDVDQTRLEASVQNLWRLTAVRKTLLSIESALNAPAPTSTGKGSALAFDCQASLAEASRLLAEVAAQEAAPTGSADVSSANPSADQPASSSAQPQPTPSTGSTSSIESIGSISAIPPVAPSSPVAPSPHHPIAPSSSVPQSPSSQVSPSSSSSLTIRAVPACPHLSVSSISRTLDRVNADMAQYTTHTSTAADYDFNVTAEEFLRPSAPKAYSTPIDAAEDDYTLLEAPDLSPSLKSQIPNLKSPPHPPD